LVRGRGVAFGGKGNLEATWRRRRVELGITK